MNKIQENIEEVKRYFNENTRTQEFLTESTKNQEKNIVLPYNSVCYIPVIIDASKPVLVCLGADQFLETTQEKAIEILQRRNQVLKNYLDKLGEKQNINKMESELQQVFDKKIDKKEEIPQPKSILKKSVQPTPEPKSSVNQRDGYSEIQEDYVEQEQPKIDQNNINDLIAIQKAYKEGNMEQFDQLVTLQQKSKNVIQNQVQEIDEKKQAQDDKQIKFKDEKPVTKKLSKFKQERLEQQQKGQ